MKKLFTLLLVSVLLFPSCTQVAEPTEAHTVASTELPTETPTEDPYAPIGDENTFLLPALPDIGKYEADKVKRWYDGPMPELIPTDEYGTLVPYAGDVAEYEILNDGLGKDSVYGTYTTRLRYGLCTVDGVIVTDPLYDYIDEMIDGWYLMTSIDLSQSLYDITVEPYRRQYLVSFDGSRVYKLLDGRGQVQYMGNNVFCTWLWGDNKNRYFRLDADTLTELFPAEYSSIMAVGDCFLARTETQYVILNRDLKPIHSSEQWVLGVNEQYFISHADGSHKERTIRHIESGEKAVNVDFDTVLYSQGRFYAMRGEELTVYDSDLSVMVSKEFPKGAQIEIYGEYCVAVGGKNSGYLLFKADGTVIECQALHVVGRSAKGCEYYIAALPEGADIYDEKLNKLAFIPDFSPKSDCTVTRVGDKLGISNDGEKFTFDPISGNIQYVDVFKGDLYTLSAEAEDGTVTRDVYSDEKLLIRNVRCEESSDLFIGDLHYFVSADRLVTVRGNGEVVISVNTEDLV